jgi:ABC-type sugar transport system permease subunit
MILWAIIFWQVIVGIACLYGASQVLQIERVFNLGDFVQYFLATLISLFGLASFASAALMTRLNGSGRLIGMAVSVIVGILGLFYLAYLLGAFIGIDQLAEGIYANIVYLWALPIGYVFLWIGGRLGELNRVRPLLERVGWAIIAFGVLAALLVPVWDPNDLTSGLLINGIKAFIAGMANLTAILVLILSLLALAVARTLVSMGDVFDETPSERDTWQGWLFLLPNFVSFMLFFAGPLALSFYLSFTDYTPLRQTEPNIVGFANYGELLSLSFDTLSANDEAPELAQFHRELARFQVGSTIYVIGARDILFWISLFQTFRYCLMLLPLAIIPALLLAQLLNSKLPGMKFFRAVFFIPSVAAVVGIALIWRWLYDPVVGFINYAINGIVGIFGISSPDILWLTDDNILLLAVVIMAAWQVIGFNTVIFLAGLQGIPKELQEAATVDGANRVQRFIAITLPMLAPSTFFVTVTTLIAGLQAFSEPFALISDNNPTDAKLTAVYYLYNTGFGSNIRTGYASAIAWVLFVLVFLVTVIQFRLSNSNAAYQD